MDEEYSAYRWLEIKADHAFECGYAAAIAGDSAMANPFSMGTTEGRAWTRGHGIGCDLVILLSAAEA